MHIKIRKTLKFLWKIRNENFDTEELDNQIIDHANLMAHNIRKNDFLSDIRYRNDYFIILILRKRKNKIKVIVYGVVKDYGRTDDVEIYFAGKRDY